MKNKIKYIAIPFLSTLAAITIVGTLVFISKSKSNSRGGFSRKFLNNPVFISNDLVMEEKIRSVCGISNGHIYFETATAGHIFETDSSLRNGHFINLSFPRNDTIGSLFITIADSSSVYIMAGNVPAILIFNAKYLSNTFLLKNKFTRSVLLTPESFVFRAFSNIPGKWNQEFIKENIAENKVTREDHISDMINDAGISTDGLLHYDKYSNLLVYVNYYSNNITCLDTNLHLFYRAHTIDTFSVFQTAANDIGSSRNGRITNAGPVHDVNLQSCVYHANLFINSAILSNNENKAAFNNNSVIDVYNIFNGLYKGSFYIPLYKEERVEKFAVYKKRFLALYKTHIVLYTMTQNF